MPCFPVCSADDPRLAPYRELNERNLTRQSGRFIAEGDKVVERLIASPFPVESLLAEESVAECFAALVPDATPVYVASRELLKETVGFNFHRGVLACGRRQLRLSLADVANQFPQQAVVVVCPDVHDPTNLGSIIRIAAAFGAAAVLVGDECAYPFSRRVLRVSMGTVLQMPVIESRDLAADLRRLRDEERFELIATVLDPVAEPLSRVVRPQRLALLLGSEGHGLSPQWLELCERRVTIPMREGVDSLNVAHAAAVFMYHFAAQVS